MKKTLTACFVFISIMFAQVEIDVTPRISQRSWFLPFNIKSQFIENIILQQQFDIFHTEYPFDRQIWYKYARGNYTMITEQSFIRLNSAPLFFQFGRSYLEFGTGRLSGLFISPRAPSLDNLLAGVSKFKNIDITNIIIRLDNRNSAWEGKNEVARRWLYLRKAGIRWGNFKGGLIDAVVSTGFDRNAEWYYLLPLSFFFMERKHQMIWRDGGDSTSVIGIGDNDNHFVGGYWNYSLKNGDFYGEWLIDEWQLSKEHRPNMQTVFAIMVGYTRKFSERWDIALEYSLGSPWLYLSRGLYNSPEYHYLPLGLPNPHMQSVATRIEYQLDKNKNLMMELHLSQKGDQSLFTKWDAWDNKISVFSFSHNNEPELKLTFTDIKGKYFQLIELKHNWLGLGGTQVVVGWNKNFTFN